MIHQQFNLMIPSFLVQFLNFELRCTCTSLTPVVMWNSFFNNYNCNHTKIFNIPVNQIVFSVFIFKTITSFVY